MPTYRILDFMRADQIIVGNAPPEEGGNYIKQFRDCTFEFDGDIKCLSLGLGPPSKHRAAMAKLYELDPDELWATPEGEMPDPVGQMQLILWQDKGPKITDIMDFRAIQRRMAEESNSKISGTGGFWRNFDAAAECW